MLIVLWQLSVEFYLYILFMRMHLKINRITQYWIIFFLISCPYYYEAWILGITRTNMRDLTSLLLKLFLEAKTNTYEKRTCTDNLSDFFSQWVYHLVFMTKLWLQGDIIYTGLWIHSFFRFMWNVKIINQIRI